MAPYENLHIANSPPPAYEVEPSSSLGIVTSSNKDGPSNPGSFRAHVAPYDGRWIVGIYLGGMAPTGSKPRNVYDVYQSVRGILRDLVLNQTLIDANSSGAGILHSCNHVCAAYGISLPDLLHRQFIDGHTPLYWAIVRRPHAQRLPLPDVEKQKRFESRMVKDFPPLIREILSYAAPLSSDAKEDASKACLRAGERWMLECLRSWDYNPGTTPRLLPDLLHFYWCEDTRGLGYMVGFEIPRFYRRMQNSGTGEIEFLAYGRLWSLRFGRARVFNDTGIWVLELMLLKGAPMYAEVALIVDRSDSAADPLISTATGWHKTPNEADEYDERLQRISTRTQIALPGALTDSESVVFANDGKLKGRMRIQPVAKESKPAPRV
ncbi:hypothetical protein MKEN_01139200 [Mycena kentingensis (nom. inval.)]|nr:hypothetical protein MKEN_01139200 [Mycena kentingensis (nom. inval.)]